MIRTMTEYIEDYVNELKLLLEALDKESILKATGIIETAHANDGTIYIIGNGGSAATASHMANDFSKGIGKRAGKHFKALSLTDNIPLLTAISNDEGYERVFVDQLKVFLNKDDLVIGISASGNSGNIVNALQYAREKGARTIGLVGFDGGKIKDMVDVCIHIHTQKGKYGPVEDMHMVLDHIISGYLTQKKIS